MFRFMANEGHGKITAYCAAHKRHTQKFFFADTPFAFLSLPFIRNVHKKGDYRHYGKINAIIFHMFFTREPKIGSQETQFLVRVQRRKPLQKVNLRKQNRVLRYSTPTVSTPKAYANATYRLLSLGG